MNRPWPPRGSESEERRRLCTLMYDFEVDAPSVQVWTEGAGTESRPGTQTAATLAAKFQRFWKSGRPLSRFVHHY